MMSGQKAKRQKDKMTQEQKDKAKTKREFNIVMTRQFHTRLQYFSGLLPSDYHFRIWTQRVT